MSLKRLVDNFWRKVAVMTGILWTLVFVGIFGILVALCLIRVPNIHFGLPSNPFRGGRFAGQDADGNSLPIRQPYREGLHFKWPWWTVEMVNREVLTTKVEKKEYQTKEGGTVLVTTMIQWRASFGMLYRFVEVENSAIEAGLIAEIDQFIIERLVQEEIESALTMKGRLSSGLQQILSGTRLNPRDPQESPTKTRRLFGRDVAYSEQSYGIEIVKVSVDIQPTPDLKTARDLKQKEAYERDGQEVEWKHLRARAKEVADEFKIPYKDAFDYVLIWQGKMTKGIQEFQIKDLEKIPEIIRAFLERN